MSNYSQNVYFGPKDSLTAGDASKKIKGTEIDAELAEISSAISSKEDATNKGANNGYCGLDSGGLVVPSDLPSATASAQGAVELATSAETITGTDTARAVTPAGMKAVLDQNAGMITDLAGLADPNVDAAIFWDDSAGGLALLTVGTGLSIAGTVLSCTITQVTDASQLTTGTLPNARIQASGVTQHQASLSIAETQIPDGSVLARVAGNETVSGAWTISGSLTKSGQGRYPYLNGSGNTGGAITISTSAASGTPADGDLWIQYTA